MLDLPGSLGSDKYLAYHLSNRVTILARSAAQVVPSVVETGNKAVDVFSGKLVCKLR